MPSAPSDLEALELFVSNNDDLLALEEHLGRFNIFDALRIEHAEIRHSNFLAWLLNPSESHGQGTLFLKAVLMDLLRQSPADRRPISAVELDSVELRDIEIRREWKSIDLLVISHDPKFIVAIENKIYAGEHSSQLSRYEQAVRTEFNDFRSMFVLLAARGQGPSEESWTGYSYQSLHGVLSRVKRTAAGSLGADVATFLDHYLNMIGTRFMDDQTIESLCKRIYTNHRRAIDLIIEHAGSATSGLLEVAEAQLRAPESRWVVRARSNWLFLVPKEWVGRRVDAEGNTHEHCTPSLFAEVQMRPDSVHLRVVVGPHGDQAARRRIIERLIANKEEFGFRCNRRNLTDVWTRVYAERLLSWSPDDLPSGERVAKVIADGLAKLLTPVLTAERAISP
ncbi:MAG: PD-(D/E)XK nuclease family protein [Phycisphaeraceae bacterium]|nr:PD-(D/E)XK nuclease family protein [Phycisphaeraceae bacterium]